MMAKAQAAQPRPPDWETPPVHPAAEGLPMMSDAELDELAADIEANGLQHPIILFRDNRGAAQGDEGPFPVYLLDGRNRLEALRRLGFDDPRRAPSGRIVDSRVRTLNALQEGALIGAKSTRVTWTPNVDPQEFVTSMNVYRRHLTQTQKRAHVAALIKADPTASDRKIGRQAGVDKNTVSTVRKELPNGEIHQKEAPVDRVKCVLRNNPSLSAYAAAKAAGVGMSTSYKARDELVEAGEIPAERPAPKPASPKVKAETEPKQATAKVRKETARRAAIQEAVTLIAELRKVAAGFAKHSFTESEITIIGEQRRALRDIIADLNAVNAAESSK